MTADQAARLARLLRINRPHRDRPPDLLTPARTASDRRGVMGSRRLGKVGEDLRDLASDVVAVRVDDVEWLPGVGRRQSS